MDELLSALDASFLYLESPRTPMHVGSLSWFEGAPLRDEAGRVRLADVQQLVVERLTLVPRFRKRLAGPPWRIGRPRWIDDDRFDVRHHVRLVTLPSPGSDEQLRALASQLHMELLDRSRPLWEMWLVDGLDDGRVAIIEKIHHALVDGVSGVDVATATMDASRETQHLDGGPWAPEPAPGLVRLIRDAAGAVATAPARSLLSRVRRPADALGRAVAAFDGLTAAPLRDVVAPRCSLNQAIGTTRLLESVSVSLAEAKEVGRAAGDGIKVNDVLLAAVAGGLRRLFEERSEPTAVLRPHALVPVSLRRDDERLGLGNLVSSLIVPLPVDVGDGPERLRMIAATTARLKQRRQAATTAAALGALDGIPPLLWSTLTPLVHRQPLVNVVVTNVPGPPVPLYLLGARLEQTVPIVPLAGNLDVSVGIVSYAGDVSFGLFADEATCPDVAVLAEGIEKSFIELKVEVR